MGKITVNLAPADIIKTGTGFDLAIAIGILQLTGILPKFEAKTLFVGELALDGRIRGVTGLLTICLWARANGYTQIFLPCDNESEVSLVPNLKLFAAQNLTQIVQHLQGTKMLQPVLPINLEQHFAKTKIPNFTNNGENSAQVKNTKLENLQKILDSFQGTELVKMINNSNQEKTF